MFSNISISKLLGICDKNLKLIEKIYSKIIKDVEYQVLEVIITYIPSHFPHCKIENKNHNIVKNGNQIVKILLNRTCDNPVMIHAKKQRFFCKNCKKTFMAETNLTNKGCFISNNVKKSIIDNLSEIIPMKVIAKNHYISPSTVARVLRSTESKNNKCWFPEVLGIDEFKSTKSVDGSMSVNLVDIETGKIIDIVSDRRKRFLGEYFNSYNKSIRNNVKYIVTDMYPTYIELAKILFPKAEIVLDKFHIVQLFTRNMNKLRINEMKNFKIYKHEYKMMKRYWKILLAKEWELESIKFYKCIGYKKFTNSRGIRNDILSYSNTLKEAYIFYQEVLSVIELKDIEGFKKLLNQDINEIPECFRTSIESLNKYKKYAINSLKTGYTNASVEGNSNLIKAYKRVSFGFRSFRNMRIRILLRNRFKTQKNGKSESLNCETDFAA
ncbi:ISL3 family transposase [Peptostreptococcus faecalis]|uniref:ISL3 family transposase n=1 Tax=Peptostreptococcus faecalis TaxID=2045015 RepID=UPI000C7B40C8|nr:ISL3 family transposase [Peptostreptococcus faecalis]